MGSYLFEDSIFHDNCMEEFGVRTFPVHALQIYFGYYLMLGTIMKVHAVFNQITTVLTQMIVKSQ